MLSQLKVLFNRLVKLVIKPATPGLQGKWFIHYTTVVPQDLVCQLEILSFNIFKGCFKKSFIIISGNK